MPDVLDDPMMFFRNRDISGGMNDKVFATEIPDNQAAELLDVDISIPGKRKKRKGYTIIADDKGSDRINALADFSPEGGTQLLLEKSGTDLRKWTGSGNWTDISTSLASDVQSDIIQGFNLSFILQGSGANTFSFDGTTLSDEGSGNTDTPRATHGTYAQNRLFLSGNSTNPLYLFYSDSLDPQTWDRTTNVIKFDEGGGNEIRGVEQWNKNLIVVGTETNIHVLDISDATPGNWTRQIINPVNGCVAFRSMVRVGNDIFYLGTDGKVRSVIRTQQDAIRGEDNPVTESIETFLEDVDKTRLSEATAVFFEEAYYLAIPISGFSRNSHVIKIDLRTRGITIYRNWNVNAWALSDLVATEVRLYGGESQADTKVYQFETGFNDNGVAVDYSETGKRINMGMPEANKLWQFIEVEVIVTGAGLLTVEAQVDNGGFTVVGTIDLTGNLPTLPIDLAFDLGGTENVQRKLRLDALGRGRDIQFRFTQDTLDLELEVLSYVVGAFVEEIENEND